MTRSEYYQQMKELARATRADHGLVTPRVMKSDLRRIYKALGIRIDLWPHRLREIRGAYFNDEDGPTVMLAKGLPEDPMVFTMAHELKHHLVDQSLSIAYCTVKNGNEHIEIGAEVFAAELIFPEQDFVIALEQKGVAKGACTAEVLVRLKRDTRTTLSYTGLAKRAVFVGYAPPKSLDGVKWKKLEEELFGEPVHKQIWRRRRGSST